MGGFMKLVKPFRVWIAFTVFFLIVQGGAELLLPGMMSDLIDKGIIAGSEPDLGYIRSTGALMLLVTLLGAAATVAVSYFSARTSVGIGRDMRDSVFAHIESLPPGSFDGVGTASLITRTTNDIMQIQNVSVMMLRMVFIAPVTCVGGVVLAFMTNVKLAFMLLIVLLTVLAAALIVSKAAVPLFDAVQDKIDGLNLKARENLTGIRVIRAFNKSKDQLERFGEANDRLTAILIKIGRIVAVIIPLMTLLFNLSGVGVMWFGARQLGDSGVRIGSLLAFIQYANLILLSLLMMAFMFVLIPRASVSLKRIGEVMGLVPEKAVSEELSDVGGRVEFSHITYTYPSASLPALVDVSFRAEAGEMVAVIGSTGSGKSTLLGLIERFFEPDSGKIFIDGTDISSVNVESLRNALGYAPQKALLFSGSIAENIRYGRDGASDDDVEGAAKTAQAYDFICAKEHGFCERVSQGGKNMSGGQKQRISIARALVRKAPIYLFDDCFSALDYKTDARLRKALKEEMSGSTVIIVSQRVSTVRDADKILVLHDGRVMGFDSHEALVSTCPAYRDIVDSQAMRDEEE